MRQLNRLNQYQRLWQPSEGATQQVTISELAARCFCSERHVRTLLRQAQEAGWLSWRAQSGRGKRGELTFHVTPESLRNVMMEEALKSGQQHNALELAQLAPEDLRALLHPFLDNWTEVNTMSGSTWLEDNAQQVPLTTTTPDSTDPTGTTDSNKNGNQSDLYKSVSMDNQEIHNGDLILVNNSTAYESTDENELEAVYEKKTDSYSVSGSELMLRGDVIENLNNMLDDFQTETGHSDIIIISGYRTTEQQQELYDADLEDTGEDTSTLVAKPGYSEHETGYAMDFSLFEDGISADYDGTGEYDWINQNCAHYGFILRYPENKTDLTEIQYESWHYRYVGQPHAYYMQQNDLCLEEYTETLKDYSVDNPLEITNWDGKVYQVYYVPAEAGDSTYVMVPPDQEYTVSGNNVDGFIITVDTGVTNLDEAEAKTTTTTATSDSEDTETTETETETDALAESDWNTEDWEY